MDYIYLSLLFELHVYVLGFCRLANFKLSASICDAGGISTDQSGVLAYMGPEILTRSHRHGTPSDFWALGVTMHEILYGTLPWIETPRRAVEYLEECEKSDASCTRSPNPACHDKTLMSLGPMKEEYRTMKMRAEGRGIPLVAHEFMQSLLDPRPWCRLSTQHMLPLAEHPYFDQMDWAALEQRFITNSTSPPVVPGSSRSSSIKRKPASAEISSPILQEELKSRAHEESIHLDKESQEAFEFFQYYERSDIRVLGKFRHMLRHKQQACSPGGGCNDTKFCKSKTNARTLVSHEVLCPKNKTKAKRPHAFPLPMMEVS